MITRKSQHFHKKLSQWRAGFYGIAISIKPAGKTIIHVFTLEVDSVDQKSE